MGKKAFATDGMGGPRSDSKETKDAYERGKKKGQRDAYEWWGKPLEQEVANLKAENAKIMEEDSKAVTIDEDQDVDSEVMQQTDEFVDP